MADWKKVPGGFIDEEGTFISDEEAQALADKIETQEKDVSEGD